MIMTYTLLKFATVLHKREAYREAFANFDPRQVARFDARKQGIAVWKVIGEHLPIAAIVVAVTHLLGDRVAVVFRP